MLFETLPTDSLESFLFDASQMASIPSVSERLAIIRPEAVLATTFL